MPTGTIRFSLRATSTGAGARTPPPWAAGAPSRSRWVAPAASHDSATPSAARTDDASWITPITAGSRPARSASQGGGPSNPASWMPGAAPRTAAYRSVAASTSAASGRAEDEDGADRAEGLGKTSGIVRLDAALAAGRHDESHEVGVGGHRCSHPCRVALPADLHPGAARMRRHRDRCVRRGRGNEFAQAPGRVGGLEQRGADERGVRPCGGDVGQVGVIGDAALGHQRRATPPRGPQQVEHAIARDLEGVEVAGVDADEGRVRREGQVELGLVVHLDECVDPRLRRGREAGAELLVG